MSGCYRFTCPSCEASVIVDSHIRDSILQDGCPLCLAPATDEMLEEVEPQETNPSAGC